MKLVKIPSAKHPLNSTVPPRGYICISCLISRHGETGNKAKWLVHQVKNGNWEGIRTRSHLVQLR